MGKLNKFNRDEINMVLQNLLQNLQLDLLPLSQSLYSTLYGQSSITESSCGDYNWRENLPGRHLWDPTTACFESEEEDSMKPKSEAVLTTAQGWFLAKLHHQVMPRTSLREFTTTKS